MWFSFTDVGKHVEMPWTDKVKAIVQGYLGGQAGASAMLNVLTGKVNPGGRLNEKYSFTYEDTPAYRYYPGKETNNEYRESIYVGYRYYNTVEKEVRFTIRNTGDRDGVEVAQLYVAKGEPNLNVLFIYNMPIRGISRMTGGMQFLYFFKIL